MESNTDGIRGAFGGNPANPLRVTVAQKTIWRDPIRMLPPPESARS